MILITGAGGLLGTSIVNKLTEANQNFISVFRANEFSHQNNEIYMDVTNKSHFNKLKEIGIKPSQIIHLAGQINIQFENYLYNGNLIPANNDLNSLYTSNSIGCTNILEYAKSENVKHIIYASTQTVYGMPLKNEIFTEETLPKPLEHYSLSKYFGEEIFKLGRMNNIDITILRFPGLYSEKRESGVLYNFIQSALIDKQIKVDFKIPIPFDNIHCDDVANAFIKALIFKEKGCNIFNIATGNKNSIVILAEKIAKIIEDTKIINNSIKQPIVVMNSNKAKQFLNWEALNDEIRLKALVEYFQNDR